MSKGIRSILAATDLSKQASIAVERAARLAVEHGARLELCCAAPMPMPMPVWGDMVSSAWVDDGKLLASTQRQLDELAQVVSQRFGIQASVHCEPGNAGSLVPARALAEGFDLIVIGATGEGALSRRLFGSTAQTIVRRASVPVLVVRRPAEGTYARLIAATDLSADALRAAQFATDLAQAAELTLFSALDLPPYRIDPPLGGLDANERESRLESARSHVRAELVNLAAAMGRPRARALVRDGRASHELVDAIEETRADLLSIGSHGKSRLEAGMLGSTSLHAVSEADCDVLVVPTHRG